MFSNARNKTDAAGKCAPAEQVKTRAMGKRFLSMALAIVMVFGLLPIMETPASAATAITGSIRLANGGDYTLGGTSATTYTKMTITVPSGVKATLTVKSNVTIDNRAGGGSPITIESGGCLVLKTGSARLTVYGQHGTNGASGPSAYQLAGGNGGYAGINVPAGAILEVWGNVTAYGGNAGAGGDSNGTWGNTVASAVSAGGGGGGGGGGAGIGGNGAKGGNGGYGPNWVVTTVTTVTAAQNGGTGGSAGTIYFIGGTSYAYGGAGGSGGSVVGGDHPGGAGGGGYPGAGIGGGGAGGGGGGVGNTGASIQSQAIVTTKTAGGGGGFSGGAGSGRSGAPSDGGTNGNGGTGGNNADNWFYSQKYGGGGGGYFSKGTAVTKPNWTNNTGADANGVANGATASGGPNGYGGKQYGEGGGVYTNRTSGTVFDRGGNGGKGGAGATVYFNHTLNGSTGVFPYNGSKTTAAGTVTTASNTTKIRTQNNQYNLGYGTGAGYTESANGTQTDVDKPGSFTASVASNKKSGELVLTWKTPSNGNLTISKVEILNGSNQVVKTFSGSTLTSAMKTPGQSNSHTLTGLTNGTSYSYKVRVTNYLGNYTTSAVSAVPYTTPNAPSGVTVAKNGLNGQLVVGWTTPANNGSALTKVEILNGSTVLKTISASSNQAEWTTNMTTAGKAVTSTVTGLTGGKSYGITVRVTNAAGSATSSPAVNGVPAGPPLAPTGVSAKGTATSGQIRVNWTTPENNGAEITSVDILNADSNAVLKTISASTEPNLWGSNFTTAGRTCTYVLSGLTDGTTYKIKVRANNSAGAGVPSAQVSAYPYTLPKAPENVTVTAGTKSLTVSWTAPNNGGSAITKYEVFELTGGVAGASPVATTTGATSATISGLNNAEGHTYAVRAVNEAGNGPLSGGALGTTFAVPSAPKSLNVNPTGTTSVEVSWEKPENDGGTPITAYVVSREPTGAGNSGATGVKASVTFTLKDLTWDEAAKRYTATLNGLAKGASYGFTVRAVNAAVDADHPGAESDKVSARLLDQPGKIEGVKVERPLREGSTTIPASGQIKVTWVAPDTGGVEITGYTIRVYEASGEGSGAEIGSEITSMTKRVDATDRSCIVGGLTNGKTYFFRVSANNQYGDGVLSDAVSERPAYVPGKPADVKATVEGLDKQTDTLLVTWGYANPNGSEIEGYKVRVYNADSTLLTTGNPTTGTNFDKYTLSDGSVVTITYTDVSEGNVRLGHSARIEGLKSGVQYKIGVCARNSFGEDPEYGTALSNPVSTLSVPGIPRNLSVAATGTSGMFAIHWDAPDFNGATDITKYQIFMYKDTYMSDTLQPETLLNKYQEEQSAGVKPGDVGETVRIKTATIDDLKALFPDGDFTRWVTQTAVNTDDNHDWVVRVRAENKIGWGTWTNRAVVAPYGAPGAISDAQSQILTGAQSVKLTWTDPDNDTVTGARGDGGDKVVSYAIHIYQKVDSAWVDVTDQVTAEGSSQYEGTVEDAQKGALILPRTGTPDTDVPAGTHVEQTVTVNGLKRGETYRADVRAINKAGASTQNGHSDIFTMWNLPTPGAYTTVTPTNNSGELRVNWYKSRNTGDFANNSENNHTDILSYNIYYRLAGNETFSAPVRVSCSETEPVNGVYSHVLETLTDGREYEIYVTAVNGAGETPHENGEVALSKGTPQRPAGAPTIGTLKSGNASAVLSEIKAPTDNGGSPVTSYRVYAQELNLATSAPIGDPVLVRTVNKVDDTMTDITVPDLVNNCRYRITVCAVNGTDMDGTPSNVAEVTVGLPEAPTNLKVEPGARFTAVATFDAANGNGSGILGYYAYVNGDPIMDPNNPQAHLLYPTVEGLKQSLTVQTDDGGNNVRIQVSAVNRVGESALTSPVTVMIGTPMTPELTRTNVTAAGAELTWTESNGNGVRMLGYNVYMRKGDSGEWTRVAILTPTTTTVTLPRVRPEGSSTLTALYKGLDAGTEYQICVRAENLVGESQNSNVMSFRFGVPGAPTITSMEFKDSELLMSFKAPTDTGLGEGTETGVLEKFTVYANGVKKLEVSAQGTVVARDGDEESECWYDAENGLYYARLTELANGSEYNVQVTASNQYGEGPRSDGWNGTPATGADAPRNVLATATSATAVELTWRAPLYNGGSSITGYIVKVFEKNGNPVTDATVKIDGMEAEITGLTTAKEYYFTVQAKNVAAPEGGIEARSEVVKTFGKPTAPQNVTFRSYKDSGTGKYNLEVHWDAPESDGDTPITGYKVWIGASLRSGGMLSPDTSSFTITGLNSTTYTLRVEAFNGVCNSAASTYGGGTYAQTSVLVGKIAAPENLRAETTADTITLKWDAVEDDFAYYKVYELDLVMAQRNCTLQEALDYVESQWQGNVPGQTVNKGTEQASWDSADPGTHYYAVKCFTNQGTGGYMSQVFEVALGGAVAPKLVSVTPGFETIDVTFKALKTAEELNKNELYGYQIIVNGEPYGGTVTMGGRTLDYDSVQKVYNDTGFQTASGNITLNLPELTGDKTYSVTVRAMTRKVDEELEITTYLPGQYEDARRVTVWTTPTAPTLLDSRGGDGEFTVRFRSSNGMGLPIAGYAVFYENSDGELEVIKSVPVTELDSSNLSITVDGIQNGYKKDGEGNATTTGWEFYVAAYTQQGDQRWYSAAPEPLPTIVTGIPGAPEITKTVAGNGSVTVYYTTPPMDPTIAVTSYVLTYEVDGISHRTQTVAGNSCTIENLTNSKVYKISVQAINQIGEGQPSEPVTVRPGTPGAPEILDYAAGDREITVRWKAPAANGPAIQSYRVFYEDSRDGSRYIENVDVNLASINLKNLENGVDYLIEIVAINANGQGQPSEPLRLMPGTLPGVPLDVTATAISGNRARVNWLEPAEDGGLAIDQYRITCGSLTVNVDAANEANYEIETDDSGKEVRRYSAVVEGLTPGEEYQFGVRAHNKRDYGEVAESNKVTTFTKPGLPQWKGISSVNLTFTAMWAAPIDNGGSEIAGYNVYLNGEQINDALLTLDNDGGLFRDERGVISYTSPEDAGLVLGAMYEVSIAAVNSVGEGEQTSTMYVTIQGQSAESVPGRTGAPVLTPGNRQLTVTWTAPTIEGVIEGVEGYYICYRESVAEGENTNPVEEIWHSDKELTTVITGLRNGTDYDVWIVARNRIGRSASSAVRTGRPEQITAPPKPENMAYQNNAQMTTMTVTWDAVTASAQGGTVYYDVYVNNIGDTPDYTTTGTSYQFSTESSLRYKIWIVARNLGGTSEHLAEEPHLLARNWLNVETTGVIGAEPNLNLDRNFDGELDEDQIATKPTAPTGLNAQVIGLNQIDLTWETPVHVNYDGTKGEPYTDIEFYNVFVNGVLYQRMESSSTNSIAFKEMLGDGKEGLKPGSIYSFQISAINGEGEGPTSSPLQILVQDSIDPTNLRATLGEGANKYSTVHLEWNKPNSATGRVPTTYYIQINGEDKVHFATEGKDITSYTWEGAVPNTNYVFRVWAEYGDAESGEKSHTTNAVNLSTVLTTPGAPADLTAEKTGDGEITLHWTASEGEMTGYRLYVDNTAETQLIPADATSYTFSTEAKKDFTFSLTAVNAVTVNTTEYSKESAQSNIAAASTREIEADAPMAPQNLAIAGMNLTGHTITLSWSEVTQNVNGAELVLESGQSLVYKLFAGRNGGSLSEVESAASDFNVEAGTVTYTYTDPEAESNVDYVFRVCAVIVSEGEEEVQGAMSSPISATTKQNIALPAKPVNLRAAVSGDKTTITLTWDPVEDPTLTGYAVFLDAGASPKAILLIEEGQCDATAPSYVYTVEDSGKTAFYFQVAALNDSSDRNSIGLPGTSELSDGRSVSLSGGDDPIITELPAAAGAPTIKKSVHNRHVTGQDEHGQDILDKNIIRVYWTAPTADVEGKPLDVSEIAGYKINIAPLNEDGTTGENFVLAEKFNDAAAFDAESGLWHYDINCDSEEYPIRVGVKYSITITAWRSFMVDETTSSEVPGAGQTPWIVMQNLNLDTNDDWIVDRYPDSTGSGSEDVVTGVAVRVTATVTAGGAADVAPTVTITDSTGETLEVEVTYNAETGALVAEFRVQPSESITYNIKITKPGCTYFELTDVPTQGVTSVDLNAQVTGGKIMLHAGDANGDGAINAVDIGLVKGNLGKRTVERIGDINGDGTINAIDLAVTKGNLGKKSTTLVHKGT